jgi:membrane-associated HD superfamily phosphohydrolase
MLKLLRLLSVPQLILVAVVTLAGIWGGKELYDYKLRKEGARAERARVETELKRATQEELDRRAEALKRAQEMTAELAKQLVQEREQYKAHQLEAFRATRSDDPQSCLSDVAAERVQRATPSRAKRKAAR